MGDEGAALLAQGLPKALRLRRLDLRQNGISVAGIAYIQQVLESHSCTLNDLILDQDPPGDHLAEIGNRINPLGLPCPPGDHLATAGNPLGLPWKAFPKASMGISH